MAQCRGCLYNTDHPFGLTIIDGLCSGCYTHKEKYQVDWGNKYQDLENIAKWAKNRVSTYNCVVPVIGDAEDYYVVSKVLELGLNPLIVSVNSYFLNDTGWANLQNLITHFDVDSWIYNPEVYTYKELIRTSLRKYNHMYLPWLQLHTSFPVHVAKEKKIPLVVWGSNQAVEQVGKFSHHDQVEMSSWSRTEHDLFGVDIVTLMGNGAQVVERKTNYYRYPEISNLGKNLRGIYLSNYMLWNPLRQNHSTINFGFKPDVNPFTYDSYERAGSSIYYGIHDLLKFERLGYRKVTDHLSRDIRHGYLDKTQGEEIVKKFSKRSVFVKDFFDWLGVTKSGYEWFLKHNLKKSREFVSLSEEVNFNTPPFPIDWITTNDIVKESRFVQFGKGVEI